MKKFFKYTLPALALCALVSCSDDTLGEDHSDDPNWGKELISFSGEGNPLTRATLTRAGFHDTDPTEILVKMVGEDIRTSPATARNTVTWATATASKTDTEHSIAGLLGEGFKHSDVTYKADPTDPSSTSTSITYNQYTRYWDDAFGRNTKLSVYAVAVPGMTGKISSNTNSGIILAVDGSVVDSEKNPNWHSSSSNTNTIEWTISQVQTATTMAKEDLTYSNNIQNGGSKGRYTWDYTNSTNSKWTMGNGNLLWIKDPNDANGTTGTFDQGHLIFKHALSYITVELTEGEGFDHTTSTDFTWTGGTETNVKLIGFTLHGTLDVKAGTWSSESGDVKDITSMYEPTGTVNNLTVRTVNAFCLPGRDLFNESKNVMEFQIDNNVYYVTGKQVAQAIRNNYSTPETLKNFSTIQEGVHYIIKLTVGKKKIDNITAEVLDWEQVNTKKIIPSNVHTTFTFEDRGTALTGENNTDNDKFYIYRAKQPAWDTGYTEGDSKDINNPIRAAKTWSTDHWTTTWYWPDNNTFYHFRAVGDFGGSTLADDFVIKGTGTTPKDYFNITSGSGYKDYIWGAPFKDIENTDKLTYSSTTGFDNTGTGTPATHQISMGISATDSPIKMLMFHVTSQVFVKIQTIADGKPDKVTLKNGDNNTKVELLRFKKNGTVQMGDGLVTATSTDLTASDVMTIKSVENIGGTASSSNGIDAVNFFYGIVPQGLSRGDAVADKVGLKITTPDGNEYILDDLSKYTGTVTTTNLTNPYGSKVETVDSKDYYTINRWLPHYQYYYTITLKKTGIQNVTAAVLPWEVVKGKNIDVNLEN